MDGEDMTIRDIDKMSEIDKQLYDQVSRMIIECRSQDGQIDEWGERELRDDFLELISTAVREAREREINDFSNSMASELGEDDSMIVIRSYRNHRLAQLKEGVQE
jgi:hypothetical protein